MKTVEAQGYNKEKALESTGIDVKLDKLVNATAMWKKSGSPVSTKGINQFFEEYMKGKKAQGAYIIVDAASDDTRKRPYSVINETTIGKRKTSTVYQIKEAELVVKYHTEKKTIIDPETGDTSVVEVEVPYHTETVEVEVVDKETGEKSTKEKEVNIPDVKVKTTGIVAGRATKKEDAFNLAKKLVEENKTSYVVEIVKEVVGGQKYAGYALYSPSKSAKIGKFVFYVQE